MLFSPVSKSIFKYLIQAFFITCIVSSHKAYTDSPELWQMGFQDSGSEDELVL